MLCSEHTANLSFLHALIGVSPTTLTSMALIELAVPGVLALAGGSLTVSSIRDVLAGISSYRWPTTQARVLAISLHPGTRWVGDTTAVVDYEYVVANQRYVSNRCTYSGRSTGLGASKVARELSRGDLVTVYYDPVDPAHSCLRPGTSVANYLALGIGLGLLIPAVLLLQDLLGAG